MKKLDKNDNKLGLTTKRNLDRFSIVPLIMLVGIVIIFLVF